MALGSAPRLTWLNLNTDYPGGVPYVELNAEVDRSTVLPGVACR